MTSNRTTLSGGAAVLAVALGIIAKLTGYDLGLSNDDILIVATAIGVIAAAIGNMFARDNKVSDQQAGVRPDVVEVKSESVE